MSEVHNSEIPVANVADAQPLIAALRVLLVTRLGHAVHRMMEKVDDALFDLAEKSENIASQSLYFDAMREVRLKRASIEESFRAHFREAFDAQMAGTGSEPPGGQAAEDVTPEWGLVDDDAVEEQIAVHNLVDKVTHGCREELYALDQRLRALLAPGTTGPCSPPMTPEVICESIRRALADLQSGLKVRLIILKLFDRYVAGELMIIYHECNEWLIGKGILPELRTQSRSPRSSRALVAQGTTAAVAAADGTPIDDASLLQALRSLLMGESQPGGAIVGGGGAAARTGSLHTLTALQQGDGQVWGEAISGQVAWAEGLRGEVNVLRSLKGSEVTRAFGPTGDLTIDIVAMLFDYILDDRSIPSALRALIGRLQIPIVKVALLDTGFFSRKSHPARRLLNTLAEAAAGAGGVSEDSAPLHTAMEQLIIRVNREFEQDIGLFAELLESFERFLVEEGERRQLRSERTRRIIGAQPSDAQREDEITRMLDLRLGSASLNDGVREFLTGHWRSLLHSMALQHGIESDVFRAGVQTMDDLIASVKPKHTPEDKRHLSTTLLGLLARLKAGMERIEVPPPARKRFLTELARVHSDAVRGRDTSGSVTGGAMAPGHPDAAVATPVPSTRVEPAVPAAAAKVGTDWVEPAVPAAAAEVGTDWVKPAVPAAAAEVGTDWRDARIMLPVGVLPDIAPAGMPAVNAEPAESALDAIDLHECDTVERLHVPAQRPVERSVTDVMPPARDGGPGAAGVPTLAAGGTVTAFDLSSRQARRITEDLVRISAGSEAAPVVPLRRGATEDRGTGTVPGLKQSTETAPWIEVPAEIAERSLPREGLADVLRSRLLKTGEVALSELIDPVPIEERLARTQPLERLAGTLPDRLLEQTLPESRTPGGEQLQGDAVDPARGAPVALGQMSAQELMALMESGTVAFEEVTLSDPFAPSLENVPEDDVPARQVAALETGTWIEFTEEDGGKRQARLTWINSSTDTFMFTDRRGLKVADRTRNGLIADFRRGSAQLVEQTGSFDHWMGRLMDGLGRAMQR